MESPRLTAEKILQLALLPRTKLTMGLLTRRSAKVECLVALEISVTSAGAGDGGDVAGVVDTGDGGNADGSGDISNPGDDAGDAGDAGDADDAGDAGSPGDFGGGDGAGDGGDFSDGGDFGGDFDFRRSRFARRFRS